MIVITIMNMITTSMPAAASTITIMSRAVPAAMHTTSMQAGRCFCGLALRYCCWRQDI